MKLTRREMLQSSGLFAGGSALPTIKQAVTKAEKRKSLFA